MMETLPHQGVKFFQRVEAEGNTHKNFYRVIALPKDMPPEDMFADETKIVWCAWFDDEEKSQKFYEIIRNPEIPMPPDIWDWPLQPVAPMPYEDVWYAYTFLTAINTPNGTLTGTTVPASWSNTNRIDTIAGGGGGGGCQVVGGFPGANVYGGGGGGGGGEAFVLNTSALTANQSTDYFIGGGGAGGAGVGGVQQGGGGSGGGGGSSGGGGGGGGDGD